MVAFHFSNEFTAPEKEKREEMMILNPKKNKKRERNHTNLIKTCQMSSISRQI